MVIKNAIQLYLRTLNCVPYSARAFKLGISQSSIGLSPVGCLLGQKKEYDEYGIKNIFLDCSSYLCSLKTNNYNKAYFNIYLARKL